MRKAIVEAGIVVNVIEVGESSEKWMRDLPDAPEAGPGWYFDGEIFSPPIEDVPVKRDDLSLSFAQLLTGLVAEGWITKTEGKAWLRGDLPVSVTILIDGLPEEMQFAAEAKAVRPSIVLRSDPLVTTLAQMQNRTEEEIDAFFVKHG